MNSSFATRQNISDTLLYTQTSDPADEVQATASATRLPEHKQLCFDDVDPSANGPVTQQSECLAYTEEVAGANPARATKPDRREYLRNYQRQWVANRRAEFFRGKHCVLCGSSGRLELDHIFPAEKTSHNIWSWSESRRNAEIAKCRILCHDCHLDATRRDHSVRGLLLRGQTLGKSGARNVIWDGQRDRWKVSVSYLGHEHFGGRFISLQEASCAAKRLRSKIARQSIKYGPVGLSPLTGQLSIPIQTAVAR